MEFEHILLLIGALLPLAMAVISIRGLWDKFRAINGFAEQMAHDEAVIEAIRANKKLLDSERYDDPHLIELEKLLIERIHHLRKAERALIEPPLYQPSRTGRARYLRKMAHEIELHQAA